MRFQWSGSKAWLSLAVLALLTSCEPSALLLDLRSGTAHYAETILPPVISPSGGAYKTAISVPAISISAPTAGSTLIYDTSGRSPVFNMRGQASFPTVSNLVGYQNWAAGTLFLSLGVGTIQAVALRDGVFSATSRADFRIVGSGGTIWANTGLGVSEGQFVSGGRYSTDQNYYGGWAINSSGNHHGYLVKTDDNGAVVASVQMSATQSMSMSTITSIAVYAGNVYVTGNLIPSAGETFFQMGSGIKLQSPGVQCGFIARYDSNLVCIWAARIVSPAPPYTVYCTGVAQGAGNVYVVGYQEGSGGTLHFEDANANTSPILKGMPTKVGGALFSNAFVGEYNSTTGLPLSSFASGNANGIDRFYAVTSYSTNIYVVGAIRGNAPTTFIYASQAPSANASQWDALLLSLDLNITNANWARTSVAGTTDTSFTSVSADSIRVLAGGYQMGTTMQDWGSSINWTGSSSAKNAMVICFSSPSGSTLWASGRTDDLSGSSSVNGLYLSGAFAYVTGSVDAGSQKWKATIPFNAPVNRSPYVARLNSGDGSPVWVTTSYAGSTSGEGFVVFPGPSVPSPSNFVAGAQAGNAGINWLGLTVKAPSTAENPLLYKIFD